MLPFVFEWQWDLGHVIFFGLFYGALGVVGFGITLAVAQTLIDMLIHPQHPKAGGEHGQEGHGAPGQ